jgi:hypothetical protein
MEKTEYTVQEAYVIETIFKKPNIKQIDLASHCLISSRILRKVINSIRKKGWITTYDNPLWLVGDNEGYSLEEKDSPRLNDWAKRFGSQAKDMNTILEVFNRTDLFTNFN